MEENPQTGNRPERPNDHLAYAILTTLFCCLPFGIVAIVNASKVNGAYSAGDYNAAKEYSGKAKKWSTWALILGAVFYVLYIILVAVGAVAGLAFL